MRLVSYLARGRAGFGAVKGEGVLSLAGVAGAADLKGLLASKDGLQRAREHVAAREAEIALGDVVLLPVIPNADKVLCIGLNYDRHRVETNSPKSDHPQVFARWNDSLTAHGGEMLRPKESAAFDYEGELAIIIGRTARRVSEADALSYVAGYSIFNDGSVRDWQKHTSQFIPGKNFPKTGALGPWMATADEVGDPSKLMVTTRLNSEVMQQDSTENLLFSVQRCIAYISAFTELHPGDVIPTGTPSGVGYRRQPPVFMKGGDKVEVEISGIGVLRNQVKDEG